MQETMIVSLEGETATEIKTEIEGMIDEIIEIAEDDQEVSVLEDETCKCLYILRFF